MGRSIGPRKATHEPLFHGHRKYIQLVALLCQGDHIAHQVCMNLGQVFPHHNAHYSGSQSEERVDDLKCTQNCPISSPWKDGHSQPSINRSPCIHQAEILGFSTGTLSQCIPRWSWSLLGNHPIGCAYSVGHESPSSPWASSRTSFTSLWLSSLHPQK